MKKRTTNQQLRVRVNVRAGEMCYRVPPQAGECKKGCKTDGCRKRCEKQYPLEPYVCHPRLN